MKLNPPLKRGKYEILTIDEGTMTIHWLLHLKADNLKPKQSNDLNPIVQAQLKDMAAYLTMEGYISVGSQWMTRVSVVIEPPAAIN